MKAPRFTPAKLAAMGVTVRGEPDPVPAPLTRRDLLNGRRSKLEARWEREYRLPAGHRLLYEVLRLPIGTIGTRVRHYSPDFVEFDAGGAIVAIHEIKGGHQWRRQGIAVLSAAAAGYPWWSWWLWEWRDGAWLRQAVVGPEGGSHAAAP